MSATYNWTWDQGADLVMTMIYKIGATTDTASPVDLTNYSVRMDLRKDDIDGIRVHTFNSTDIAGDTTVDVVGPSDNEITLGADGKITVTAPRSLTLPPSGVIYTQMATGSTKFYYDMMLRNNSTNKQVKIMEGTIEVVRSATLWT